MESKDKDNIDSSYEELRNRVFDLYQHKTSNTQKMFGILIGFTLAFFFIIFLPYVSDLRVKNELAQNITYTSDLINQSERQVSRYYSIYNGIKQLNSELNKAPTELENFVTNILNTNNSGNTQYENSTLNLTDLNAPTYTKLITNESNTYLIFVDHGSLNFKVFDRNNNLTQHYTLYNSSGRILDADMVVHNSNVYVLWREISDENGTDKIFFKSSTDNGNTFKPTITLATNGIGPIVLKLIASANNIYVIGTGNLLDIHSECCPIFFTKSTNNGTSFEPFKKLGVDHPTSFNIAISNNNIYIIWKTENVQENSLNVYFMRSTDNGNTFKPVNIIFNYTISNSKEHDNSLSGTAIDAQDNYVYIAWSKISQNNTGSKISSVYFKRSEDNGSSFSSTKRIENVSGEIETDTLGLKTFKNNLYIIWDASTENKPGISIPLHFDLSIKMSFDHEQNFMDKNSIIKSKSYPILSKLFVEQYDITILTFRGNDLLMSKSSASGHSPFDTLIFTNATEFKYTNLNNIGFNSEGVVYALSGNNNGSILNIFSPKYTLSKKTQDLSFPECVRESNGSSNDHIFTFLQDFQCNVKTFTNNLLKTFNPKIEEIIIRPLENIGSDNSKTFTSNIHSNIKRLPAIFDNVLSKQYPLLMTLDGRTELENILINQSNQFWKQYEREINNQTQQLVAKINNFKNETKQLSAQKEQLIKHQSEIVDRLQHIQTPFGEIPVGFNESMAAYPLILSVGLLILAFMLNESIDIRKTFHLLSLKKDPKREVFTNKQIALSSPLWIDPISPRITQIFKFVLLLIPFIIFILSCYMIFSLKVESTFPIFSENSKNNELLYMGVYVFSSTFFIYGYYQIIKRIRDYRRDLSKK